MDPWLNKMLAKKLQKVTLMMQEQANDKKLSTVTFLLCKGPAAYVTAMMWQKLVKSFQKDQEYNQKHVFVTTILKDGGHPVLMLYIVLCEV